MTMNLFPAAPKIRADAAELQPHERSRYRAAAGHARRVYPGPLGELAYRELIAYAEFGYRFSDGGSPAICGSRQAAPSAALRRNESIVSSYGACSETACTSQARRSI